MKFEPHSNRGQSKALQVLAMSAAGKSPRPANNGKNASSRGRDESSRARGAGTVAVLIAALVVLSVGWAVHRQWSEDSGVAEAEARSGAIPREGLARPERPARSPFAAAPAARPAEERAAKALAEQQRSSAVPADTAASEEALLLEALTAPQEEVRAQSLEQALGTGVDVPLDTLQDLLASDPSDGVRELALQGLTERPEATREEIRSILEAAVANPSAAVRASAQRMIEQMNALDQMDEQARAFRRRSRAAGNERW